MGRSSVGCVRPSWPPTGRRVTGHDRGSITGAAMAAAASAEGADRIFLMGYDYHWADTVAGCFVSAPPEGRQRRRPPADARSVRAVRRSGRAHAARPAPVRDELARRQDPIGAPSIGSGEPWILRRHVDVPAGSVLSSRSATTSRSSSSMPLQTVVAQSGALSTSTHRRPWRPSLPSRTNVASLAPGSGRSATNVGCPGTRS